MGAREGEHQVGNWEEKMEPEKQEAYLKWEIKKPQTFGSIYIEKEKLQLIQYTKYFIRIMFVEANL